MPHYRYRCEVHGDFEAWVSIHVLSEKAECPVCPMLCPKVFTAPRISVYATPNKGEHARRVDATEARWDKDMPAYKRLRKEGLQPKSVDGAHLVEAMSHDRMEVEMGRKVPPEKLEIAREVRAELKENERTGEGLKAVRDLPKVPA